ncbi:hypothetical protein MKY84_01645 [Chryseomicrobium sp. FSL W7-1435]|uniref:hypothetical protein n=1 Tax=Chryseomicrobium sp. FSL W7-1435 TaxID=2921704 RepID=UPI00315AC213
MKSLMGCLFAVVIFISLSIIGVFAFFTLAPQQSTVVEISSTGMESVSPKGDYRVEIIDHGGDEPYEVYYGRWEQEIKDMSMLYMPKNGYANPSMGIEWQEENVAYIMIMDGEQEKRGVTLTIGED